MGSKVLDFLQLNMNSMCADRSLRIKCHCLCCTQLSPRLLQGEAPNKGRNQTANYPQCREGTWNCCRPSRSSCSGVWWPCLYGMLAAFFYEKGKIDFCISVIHLPCRISTRNLWRRKGMENIHQWMSTYFLHFILFIQKIQATQERLFSSCNHTNMIL